MLCGVCIQYIEHALSLLKLATSRTGGGDQEGTTTVTADCTGCTARKLSNNFIIFIAYNSTQHSAHGTVHMVLNDMCMCGGTF